MSESDAERVAVKTYVPRYQKEQWHDHATALEMSQSEFVRTMVQAGRSEVDVPGTSSTGQTAESPSRVTAADGAGSTDGSSRQEFDERIKTVLERNGALDWRDLVDALVDDVEGELDAALERLQAENEVRYSGPKGGYLLTSHE